MAASDEEENSRWSLQNDIAKVFNTSLKTTFKDRQVPLSISTCRKDDNGDYICSSMLDIWPDIRNTRMYKGPKHAGLAIKKNLPDSASNMMESCVVCGPGLVKFTLCRTWIAERLRFMLLNGIRCTWAPPKISKKRAIVYFLSPNIGEEMHMGHLRSIIIGEALACMLEYCRVDVLRKTLIGDHRDIKLKMLTEFLIERFPDGKVDDQAIGELDVLYKESKKRFDEDAEFRQRVEQGSNKSQIAWKQFCKISRERYQKVYERLEVPVIEEVKNIDLDISKTLHLLGEKGLTKESDGDKVLSVEGRELPLMKSDGDYDLASKILASLWHELNVVKSDLIMHVSDVGQRNCIEMCITTAEHAGWIVTDDCITDDFKYPICHVGFALVHGNDLERFQSRSSKVINLVDLLDQAKSRCKTILLKRGRSDHLIRGIEHTAEALGYGAVKYAYLKNNRLSSYTFSFDEMFNEKGNTFVYIQYTHARIYSMMRRFNKDIKKIKVGELLKKDEERELGLHLLRFTEVLGDACRVLMPHFLCEYLYDLCKKFNNLFPGFFPSFFPFYQEFDLMDNPSKFLLCQAAAVVIRECLYLLGISPIVY